MKELVEVVAKALVDNPDEVVVTEKTEGKNIVLELHVAASDMGKVIGKQGRIAKGAGVDIATVNRFIKQFEQTQKMMKQFGGGKKGRGGMGGMFGGGKFPGIGGRFF